MIYITGDCHGSEIKFLENNMPGENTWTEDDKLIICGDFGFIWFDDEYPEGKAYFDGLLDFLESKSYDILFVDGNHENFNELYKFPEVERYGNTVHKIRRNIFHLQRGRIYTIEGKTFFAFGGAYSIDKASRFENISWWPQELPNEEEYRRGLEALKAVGNKVDYIVTHTAPDTALEYIKYSLAPQERNALRLDHHDMLLRNYFDIIWHSTEFKRWYFGHFHYDKHLTSKARALLNDVEVIED